MKRLVFIACCVFSVSVWAASSPLEIMSELGKHVLQSELHGSCGRTGTGPLEFKATLPEELRDFVKRPFADVVGLVQLDLQTTTSDQVLGEVLRTELLTTMSRQALVTQLQFFRENPVRYSVFVADIQGEFSIRIRSLIVVDSMDRRAVRIEDGYCE